MFASVPQGDAIMLKAVLHNWDDDKCLEILRNCYKALPENGKVIVVDKILPEIPEPTGASMLASVIDNLMLIITGGKERTVKEYENLCKRSGFSKSQVGCFAISGVVGVIEFYK
ncbi:hypothetical protein L6164_025291 [Bauhinia variegata]|uniref:Uncharacterized protein n=1 Tax=Bauhinia variegata TaxID=167791 RepID=A0ACB9M0H3_BAUVA|nr:hypothetical protein L6164_025291 [Bauhinia variegata]